MARAGQIIRRAIRHDVWVGGAYLARMLGLRKAAEADFLDAEARLHFGQAAGLDEAAQGVGDGVEKAELKEAEGIADLETALSITSRCDRVGVGVHHTG